MVVSVTVDNNFTEDSFKYMGYNNLPIISEQPQQRFFEKILSREEIGGICDIERNL